MATEAIVNFILTSELALDVCRSFELCFLASLCLSRGKVKSVVPIELAGYCDGVCEGL